MLQCPLVQLYLLHPKSYFNGNNLGNLLVLYGGSECKTILGKLGCHDPTGMFSKKSLSTTTTLTY